jgi:MFS family permease
MRHGARVPNALYLASFVSAADRAIMPPLLVVVAFDLGGTIEEVAYTIGVNSLAYAGFQLVWSSASDRFGRIAVIRISTAIGILGCVLAAVAPSVLVLGLARAITGAAFAATVPATLTYFGDTLRQKDRLSALANIAIITSAAAALGMLGAALIADFATWRLVFVVVGVAGIVSLLPFIGIRDTIPPTRARLAQSIRILLADRWVVVVLVLVGLEGFTVLGVLSYLPAAAQHAGASLAIAGAITSSYGVAVIVFGQLVKRLGGRVPSWGLLATGGGCAVCAYLLMAVWAGMVPVLIGSVLLGAGWAIGHTSMQTWLTDAATRSRATGTSLFAMSLFGGAALGTVTGAGFVSGGHYTELFLLAAAIGAVFAGVAGAARYRYVTKDE